LWWNTPFNGLRFGASGGVVPLIDYTSRITTRGGSVLINTMNEANFQQFSGEYLWKAWTFQTEFYLKNYYAKSAGPADTHSAAWYVSAAYRFNKRFEAGAYYTEFYNDIRNRNGSRLAVPSDGYQKDAALALRFDLTDRWIFKVEGHYIRGTGLLQDSADNPARNGDGWFMVALKTTISF
jgi:hypothetical protein